MAAFCLSSGAVAGAACAAAASYYFTASALAALAEERALRRASEAPSTPHRRHGKHHKQPPPGVGAAHNNKGKGRRLTVLPRDGGGEDTEEGGSASEGGEEALQAHHGRTSSWASKLSPRQHSPRRAFSPQRPSFASGGSGVGGLARPGSTGDPLGLHPEYQQRMLADAALPSRAASRLTAALGATPEMPHAPSGAAFARYDGTAAAASDTEADPEAETGLETEAEADDAARSWRAQQGAAALAREHRGAGSQASEAEQAGPAPAAHQAHMAHMACQAKAMREAEAHAASHSSRAAWEPPKVRPPHTRTAPPSITFSPALLRLRLRAASARQPEGCSSSAAAERLRLGAYLLGPGAPLTQPPPLALLAQDAGGEYDRVTTPEEALTAETEEVCRLLAEALALRARYLIPEPPPARAAPRFVPANKADPFHTPPGSLPGASGHVFAMVDGVMHVWPGQTVRESGCASSFPVPGSATDFFSDLHHLCRVTASGPVKSFCHRRLALLEQRFSLHLMLNADREFLAQKAAPHRDFYNCRKVDTHVHHSACMNQKHLLRFIKSRLRHEPDGVVIFRDGKYLTLSDVFRSVNLTAYDLNVDTMDMHADKDTFHRFDRFNLKYNPCGESRLREIFIKQDNLIRGRFLADLTKEVFSDLEANKYQMAEYRISVYGRKATEWDTLAAWVCNHSLYSDNVVWLIQLPRLYSVYKEAGTLQNFQELLDNVFTPLFEVTADPSSHPQLHAFLQTVVGFDMVDDESKPERRPAKHMRTPADWDLVHNPAYAYYAYYVWANLFTLNKLRAARGMRTLAFRPHAGEAGDIDHLVAAFLLAKNIAHGNNLRKSPGLQYCFYLAQIGLNMSPLSNNSLFLDYHKNPFPQFFARGLPVALSTDDPLQIHLTKEPLVEEYSVAAQVWKLSSCDLCEIARTSVLNSGFSHADKCHWVGDSYWQPGSPGNDTYKTNVPSVRVRFRHDTLTGERQLIERGAQAAEARRLAKGGRRYPVV